tara:strand:+ start:370 stop:597 length:228 start_codon:yes stop_codon:yes gene_type:complete
MKCLNKCIELDVSCPNTDCRFWIDYEEDLNCVHETIDKHGNLTLREVSDRIGVSFVRVKQLEDSIMKKLSKMIKL